MNRISEHLKENYEIYTSAGGKGECPFCHKMNFSVKRDDSLGKCFNCGKVIYSWNLRPGYEENYHRILYGLYEASHKELLETKNDASDYLTKRGIHYKIKKSMMIGIIPKVHEFEKKIDEIIGITESKVHDADIAYQNATKRMERELLWS